MVGASAHGPPRVQGDPEDDRGDREADQRVGDRQADRDDRRRGDHGEADVGVGARVVAVGDQGRAVEAVAGAGADARCDPIAREADQPRGGQGEQVRRGLRMDQPRDRLDPGDAGGEEDHPDDEQSGPALGPSGAQHERHAERNRRAGITEVVDQVGEQGNAAAGNKDRQLSPRRKRKHRQRHPNRPQPLPRPFDALVHQPVRVPVPVMAMLMVMWMRLGRVSVRVGIGMLVARSLPAAPQGELPADDGQGPVLSALVVAAEGVSAVASAFWRWSQADSNYRSWVQIRLLATRITRESRTRSGVVPLVGRCRPSPDMRGYVAIVGCSGRNDVFLPDRTTAGV